MDSYTPRKQLEPENGFLADDIPEAAFSGSSGQFFGSV